MTETNEMIDRLGDALVVGGSDDVDACGGNRAADDHHR